MYADAFAGPATATATASAAVVTEASESAKSRRVDEVDHRHGPHPCMLRMPHWHVAQLLLRNGIQGATNRPHNFDPIFVKRYSGPWVSLVLLVRGTHTHKVNRQAKHIPNDRGTRE